jgi:hypothetical protein
MSKSIDKQNKAWIVNDTTYDWTEVIFAPTRHEAFYKSDGYQNEGHYTEMRGCRKKEWDQYADQGYVPKEVRLEDGWWFECAGRKTNPDRGCWKHITQEDKYTVIDEKVYCEECACAIDSTEQPKPTEVLIESLQQQNKAYEEVLRHSLIVMEDTLDAEICPHEDITDAVHKISEVLEGAITHE